MHCVRALTRLTRWKDCVRSVKSCSRYPKCSYLRVMLPNRAKTLENVTYRRIQGRLSLSTDGATAPWPVLGRGGNSLTSWSIKFLKLFYRRLESMGFSLPDSSSQYNAWLASADRIYVSSYNFATVQLSPVKFHWISQFCTLNVNFLWLKKCVIQEHRSTFA